MPVAAISWCQCRSRMAGFWSSVMARRDMRRFFTLLSKPVKASHVLTWQGKEESVQGIFFIIEVQVKNGKKEGLLLFSHDKSLWKWGSNQMQSLLINLNWILLFFLTSLSRTLKSLAKCLHCSSMSSTLISLQGVMLHAAMLDSTMVIMSQSSFSRATSCLCQGQD